MPTEDSPNGKPIREPGGELINVKEGGIRKSVNDNQPQGEPPTPPAFKPQQTSKPDGGQPAGNTQDGK
jgi:hypothetical protein